MIEADVLVIGAGIAGLSAAWHAKQAGRDVTIVARADQRASDVPVALINPLRGHTGRMIADGVEGMHASFALIDALRDGGHPIDGDRGLYRPLIDATPDAMHEAFWRSRLDGRLSFDWLDVAPASLGLVDRVPCLFLRDAGWVGAESLLHALAVASAARRIDGQVTGVTRVSGRTDLHDASDGGTRDDGRYRVSLDGGEALSARSILWCGGARGAAWLDAAASSADEPEPRSSGRGSASPPQGTDRTTSSAGIYKPGSLVAVGARLTGEPLAFGLYAVPNGGTTLIGPTREGSWSEFPDGPVPPDAVLHLGDRIARVFGTTMAAREAWRGVRLGRLSSGAASALAGIPTLTALGSRGFLMAPLLAARWARSL